MDGKYQRQIKNTLLALLVILILAVLKLTSSISITIFLSLFLFLLFLPLMNALDKAKIPSFVSLLIVILLLIIISASAVIFLFYSVDQLLHIIPSYASKAEQFEKFLVSLMGKMIDLPENFSLFGALDIDWLGLAVPVLKNVSSSALGIISDAMVVILMTLFLLVERSSFIPKIESVAQSELSKKKITGIIARINTQVSRYLGIKFLVSLATALCFYFIGLAVGLECSLIIGVLTFILNFIPTFGSIIITVVAIAIATLQFFPNWSPIILVAIGTISTQMIIGNIIDPRLQGNRLNLSPFVILVSLSIFGYIFGIVGMFLAVPLLSVLQIIFINIENTKPIAFIISSGHSIKKELKGKKAKKQDDQLYFDDFVLPEN